MTNPPDLAPPQSVILSVDHPPAEVADHPSLAEAFGAASPSLAALITLQEAPSHEAAEGAGAAVAAGAAAA